MTAVLEIAGLGKSYGGLAVLEGLDLSVEPGARLGLVGANGSGKTTLIDIVSGHTAADRGTICLGGHDITAQQATQRAASGVGRTWQDSRLWPALDVGEHLDTVLDAVAGARPDAPVRLSTLCAIVGLAPLQRSMRPDAMRLYDRRRLELILAALVGSELLLIDEIGAGLHRTETLALYGMIQTFVDEGHARAAILVEHKLDVLASAAGEIALVAGGAIAVRTRTDDRSGMGALTDRMYAAGRARPRQQQETTS